MKKFKLLLLIIIVTGLIMESGCATKKLSKTSFLDSIRHDDFCEKFTCAKYGLSKEKVNEIVLGCWEQELQNLPPMFTKDQIDEIIPSVKLCLQTKGKTENILSKEDLLYLIANKDFSKEFPKASELKITKQDLNNLAIECFEQEMKHLPTEFSINQFLGIEENLKSCMRSKMKTDVKISKELIMKKIWERIQTKEFIDSHPEMKKLHDMGIDLDIMFNIIKDCYQSEMENLPSRISISQMDAIELDFEKNCLHKIKAKPILEKSKFIHYIINQIDLFKKYPKTVEYGVPEAKLKKIVLGCIELELKNLPERLSFRKMLAFFKAKSTGDRVDACINKQIQSLTE